MKQSLYRKDRICYILEELFNYLISLLMTGSYLAKITTTLGISDGLTAILSSFVTLGYTVQLLSGIVFRKGYVKRRLTGIFAFSQLLFTMLYLVPFVRIGHGLRTLVFMLLLLFAELLKNLVLAPRTNWFMSFVDDRKRGVFTAKKEAVSLIVGFLFQMGMGALIDNFEASGNIRGAFVVCALVIFGLAVVHTLTLLFTEDREVPESKQSLKKGIREALTDPTIRPVLLLSVFWAVAYNVAVPFYGTYTIKELGFSMSFLAMLSLAGAVARILASIFFGKYADKHSFAKMLRLCYCLSGLSFLVAAFARPENGYVLYSAYAILGAMSMGGINSAVINLIFDYVVPEKRTLVLGMRQTIYGITGFLVSAAATPLLQWIQSNDNRIFGLQIYAQQVLSLLAVGFVAVVILYLERVVMKLRPVAKT